MAPLPCMTKALALASLIASATAQGRPQFEVDIIFPRNETYKPSELMPIALAIQNVTAIETLGKNYTVSWYIVPFAEGTIPGMTDVARGQFALPKGPVTEPFHVFMDGTNTSEWRQLAIARRGTYMFQWYVNWDGLKKRCGYGDETLAANGDIMFDIKYKEEYHSFKGDNISDYDAQPELDVLQAPECPALGGVVEMTQSTAPSACPTVVTDRSGQRGNPCAVKVDEAMASRISSYAASRIMPTATATPRRQEEDNSNAGKFCAMQPALAAACLVSGMVLLSYI